MQLLCLTYAGGTAAFYNQFDPYFDSSIEIIKLEYAGHGARHKEPFYKDFFELADDMYMWIKELKCPSQEYALIGYSMGSISLVEVLNLIIERKEIPLPKYVFLAAHEPIPKKELSGFTESALDDFVKDRTIKFGGIPQKLMNNKSFWRMYLPIYRNDYSILEKYNFDSISLRTEIPVVVFYSPTDTNIKEMLLWKKYFVGETEFLEYEGNHFFIQNHCKEICRIINEKLQMEDRKNDI